MIDLELAQRVQTLRKRCGLSIRQLAGLAGVTPGIVSCIERGKSSPSITMLQKILAALGTDLATFFAAGGKEQAGPVFLRQQMRTLTDGDRRYTIVFPKRRGISVELLDEHIYPGKRRPPFEILKCDVAGYLISGCLVLEIKGQEKQTLRPGDGFYIPKGLEHRGFATDDGPVRLVTAYYPAKY
jgi:transcriptional regulator with XRE-family HTH domain